MRTLQNKGQIIIYRDSSGPTVRIQIDGSTVWMTQAAISDLFGTDRTSIGRHLRNIINSEELEEKSNVQNLHIANSDKPVKFYNLDFILSVGYRVNSRRATQFRKWATEKLREYLVAGYLINERRLRENQDAKLTELRQAHLLIQEALESRRLDGFEKELVNIISDYTNTWVVLNQYDTGQLKITDVTNRKANYLEYGQVRDKIERFKKRLMSLNQASGLFGQEVGNRLGSLLGSVQQSFDSVDVYSSIEEKATHLFYFIIKDRPFVDGNKRIASLMLVLFLIENRILYNRKGERRINDSALAALALLVAESKPSQKDVMIKLIVNLINKK